MGRGKIVYVCSECGYEARKWMGRCPGCGGWTTMVEERINRAVPSGTTGSRPPGEPASLNEVEPHAAMRLPTTLAELDRVLGGGIVPGTVILVGGDPGIGKSTLYRSDQLVSAGHCSYVIGQSLQQIKMRTGFALQDNSLVLAETEYDRIAQLSLNTIPGGNNRFNPNRYEKRLGSVPGSVYKFERLRHRLSSWQTRKCLLLWVM